MSGQEEFIDIFGHITVANVFEAIVACIFVYKVYDKIRQFFIDKAKEDMKHKQEIADMIETVKELAKDRQVILDNQKAMQEQLTKMSDSQEDYVNRIEELECSINNRERSKLRDRIIQSYRYYTSTEHNPLQKWTAMEADAFWSLFADYETINGNGYVHTVVQPAMQNLGVVEMNDEDGISKLMATRK